VPVEESACSAEETNSRLEVTNRLEEENDHHPVEVIDRCRGEETCRHHAEGTCRQPARETCRRRAEGTCRHHAEETGNSHAEETGNHHAGGTGNHHAGGTDHVRANIDDGMSDEATGHHIVACLSGFCYRSASADCGLACQIDRPTWAVSYIPLSGASRETPRRGSWSMLVLRRQRRQIG